MSESTDPRACKSCGNAELPITTCSNCSGYGMRHGSCGEPEECSACGCSGVQWPPVCPGCSKYRSMKGFANLGEFPAGETV